MDLTLASRWIAPGENGGIAEHNRNLVDLLKNEMNISLVSSSNELNRTVYGCQGIPYREIELQYAFQLSLKWFPAIKNLYRTYFDWRYSQKLANILGSINTGVIEFMDIHSEAYHYLKINKSRKVKVVIRSHTPWGLLRSTLLPEEIKGEDAYKSYEREYYCFHQSDAITTPSQDLKDQLIRLYHIPEAKITVIPNIVDTNHFRQVESIRENDFIRILYVGRFERAKGTVTLIKAFATLCNEFKNLQLICVGHTNGDAIKIADALVQEYGIGSKVINAGFMPYEELPTIYSSSDIVVVPSEIYESFSYTVAQAMSCGKPVIASDVGGMRETTNYGEAGWLFEKGNSKSLEDGLRLLIKNDSSRRALGAEGLDYFNNNFSMAILKKKFCDFYRQLDCS